MPPDPDCVLTVATAGAPGAIAVLWLEGDVEPVVAGLTGMTAWPVGSFRLADLGDVDEGIVARPADRRAVLMPHGGPRIVQRLVHALVSLGAAPCDPAALDPCGLYPEARDEVEALMLATLARARSRLAIDLLLDQPRRWRADTGWTDADDTRSRRLDRLVTPADVVLVGAANIGKSTLSNALLGRAMSIEHDEPGTTRDYTVGLVDLGGLTVRWHDTPGLRATDDPIEADAQALASRLVTTADLLVAVTDPGHPWPALHRPPDLRIATRSDIGPVAGADVSVCAPRGAGLEALARAVADRLVPPPDRRHPGPWRFDDRLGVPGLTCLNSDEKV